MTYAAYLRIYEPVAAFHEPDRSRWVAYAASSARPGQRDSLAVEQAEALHRAIAAPQIVMPDQESEHAYVRRADGVTYVCPWQTRLRCLLAYGRMLSTAGSALPGVIPDGDDHETMTALARLADGRAAGPGDQAAHPGQRLDRAAGLVRPVRSDRTVAGARTGRQAAVRPANRVRDPGAAVHHAHVPGPQAGSPRPGGAARACRPASPAPGGIRPEPRPNSRRWAGGSKISTLTRW